MRPALALVLLLASTALAQPADLVERARATGPAREALTLHPDAAATLHAEGDRWRVDLSADGRTLATVVFDADGRVVDALLDPDVELRLRPQLPTPWAGALALLVVLALFGPRLDAFLLLALTPFLALPDSRLQHTGIWCVTLAFFCRAVWLARAPREPRTPRPTIAPLAALLLLALAYHAYVIQLGVSEDSGIWGCFGAQYLLRTGEWPYGQAHFGDGSTYGPLFYLLLAPLVALLPPGYAGPEGFVPLQEWIPPTFERLDFAASKALVGLADLAIVAGLVAMGRLLRRDRDAGWRLGLALAVVYAVLPYTLIELIHPSRSVPTAFVLAAIVAASRPLTCGLLLGAATATMHFPAVLIPLFAARHRGRALARFAAGLALVAGLCLAAIHVGDSDWSRFWVSTWQNLEGEDHYGSSPYGFWGTNPTLALAKVPLRVLHLVGCLALFRVARGATRYQLAAWTAAVLTGIQLWKTHGGGSYISWHLPFLLIALLAPPDPLSDHDG